MLSQRKKFVPRCGSQREKDSFRAWAESQQWILCSPTTRTLYINMKVPSVVQFFHLRIGNSGGGHCRRTTQAQQIMQAAVIVPIRASRRHSCCNEINKSCDIARNFGRLVKKASCTVVLGLLVNSLCGATSAPPTPAFHPASTTETATMRRNLGRVAAFGV